MYSLNWFNNPRLFRRLVNLWPPMLGAGISVTHISDDWMQSEVRMKLRFYNRNFVGTHFGGSLFAMTDMMYMLMLLHHIGKDYWVWDKSADIEFVKPGRGVVFARFQLDRTLIERIMREASIKQKHFEPVKVEIRSGDGELVAHVNRMIYVRKKPAA
ncbi:MAG: DUF4442 domain-containing protein [bacterium]